MVGPLDDDGTITDHVVPTGVLRPYVRLIAEGYPSLFRRGPRPQDFVALYQALNFLEWSTRFITNGLVAAVMHPGGATWDADQAALMRSFSAAGYSTERYVGRLALIGGGVDFGRDEDPRATINRELQEELVDPALAEVIIGAAEFAGVAILRVANVDPERKIACHVVAYVAEVDDPHRLRQARLREGVAMFVPELGACPAPLRWGHDHLLAKVVGQPLPHPLDPDVDMEWIGGSEPLGSPWRSAPDR